MIKNDEMNLHNAVVVVRNVHDSGLVFLDMISNKRKGPFS